MQIDTCVKQSSDLDYIKATQTADQNAEMIQITKVKDPNLRKIN